MWLDQTWKDLEKNWEWKSLRLQIKKLSLLVIHLTSDIQVERILD